MRLLRYQQVHPVVVDPGDGAVVKSLGEPLVCLPAGDETVTFGLEQAWRTSAGELNTLTPDSGRVRSQAPSGQAADAAREQFAQLFDGDFSVDKLSSPEAATVFLITRWSAEHRAGGGDVDVGDAVI